MDVTKTNNATNLNSLKESNFSLVIRTIRENKQCSRVYLVEKTGLKQATITKIITQLKDWGLVVENKEIEIESSMGRKPIGIEINANKYWVCAARIQRSKISVGLFDLTGCRSAIQTQNIENSSTLQAMRLLKKMIKEAIEAAPVQPLAIGLALPGPFDFRNGHITLMSGFPGWDEIDIKKELSESFGLPILLEQDANCGAMAEQWYGGHEASENILYIIAAEGVGAGLILNGQLIRGMQGFAGEIGHMSINMYGARCECGNRGCLELYTTIRSLEEEYKRQVFESQASLLNKEEIYLPAQEILKRVREGNDVFAYNTYEKIVSVLSFGAVSVINAINPNTVIFADTLSEGGPCFLEIIERTFKRYLLKSVFSSMKVAVSPLQGDPMLLGASVVAFEYLLQQPSKYFQS